MIFTQSLWLLGSLLVLFLTSCDIALPQDKAYK